MSEPTNTSHIDENGLTTGRCEKRSALRGRGKSVALPDGWSRKNRLMKVVWLVFVGLSGCLLMGSLHAKDLLLLGAVGAYPIVMDLSVSDNNVSGTYFYRKYKMDISLNGTINQQGYHLHSATGDDDTAEQDDKAEQFLLIQTTGDTFKGTFTSAKGTSLPVKLRVVLPASVSDPKPGLQLFNTPGSTEDAYERLRLAEMKFIAGKKETIDGKYLIQWYTEPLSNFSMFYVIGGYPKAVLASINRIVDEDYYSELKWYFSCTDTNGKPGTPGAELGVSNYLLNDRFVSYAVSSSWYCGGPHPDFSLDGTTINAKTGKKLTLDDMYRPGTGEIPAINSDALEQYHKKVLTPAIIQLFTQLYPKEMKKDNEGCDYTDPEVWESPGWYLVDKGLYVMAFFPHAEMACELPDWSVIPWSILKKSNPALFAN